jgi:hypothetical protein
MLSTATDTINNPDIAEPFIILRSTGQQGAGGWQSSTTNLSAYGVCTVAEDTFLEMIPEADRVHGGRVFVSTTQMYTTEEMREDGTSGTSDILKWHGRRYRIRSVGNFSQRGYYFAVATRMLGT